MACNKWLHWGEGTKRELLQVYICSTEGYSLLCRWSQRCFEGRRRYSRWAEWRDDGCPEFRSAMCRPSCKKAGRCKIGNLPGDGAWTAVSVGGCLNSELSRGIEPWHYQRTEAHENEVSTQTRDKSMEHGSLLPTQFSWWTGGEETTTLVLNICSTLLQISSRWGDDSSALAQAQENVDSPGLWIVEM